MAAILETVVRQLEEPGVVAPGKLDNFVPSKAHPKDAEELLREWIRQQVLPKFQAQ